MVFGRFIYASMSHLEWAVKCTLVSPLMVFDILICGF